MRILKAAVGLLSVFGLVGCANSEKSQPLQATWDPTNWFGMSAPARLQLEEENRGLLWVTGPNVSMPFDLRPEQLAAQGPRGNTLVYPDITVPTAIAAGTTLDLHIQDAGKLSEVLAQITVYPTPPGLNSEYTVQIEAGEAQCYDGCNHLNGCHWCKVCPAGYCYGVARGPWVSSGTINNCGSKGGTCNSGGGHACWTVTWYENCGPAGL
jgi:hypothetical protein